MKFHYGETAAVRQSAGSICCPGWRFRALGFHAQKMDRGPSTRGARKNILTQSGPPPFDENAILAKVGDGKTVLKFKNNDVIFSQGDQS
jgi:hypothetical protein